MTGRGLLVGAAVSGLVISGVPAVSAAPAPPCQILKDSPNDTSLGALAGTVPDGQLDILSADVATHHVVGRDRQMRSTFTAVIRVRRLSDVSAGNGVHYRLATTLPGSVSFGVTVWVAREPVSFPAFRLPPETEGVVEPAAVVEVTDFRVDVNGTSYATDASGSRRARAVVNEARNEIVVTVGLPFLATQPINIRPRAKLGPLSVSSMDSVHSQLFLAPNDEGFAGVRYVAGTRSCVQPLPLT